MKNTIGFLFTALRPAPIPLNQIITTAAHYHTYLINHSDSNLCDFNAAITKQLNTD